MAGMKHEEIAKVFGVGGYSAVSSVIGRTQSELVKMERLRGGLSRFATFFKDEPRADLTP
jgi:hypothetical protein